MLVIVALVAACSDASGPEPFAGGSSYDVCDVDAWGTVEGSVRGYTISPVGSVFVRSSMGYPVIVLEEGSGDTSGLAHLVLLPCSMSVGEHRAMNDDLCGTAPDGAMALLEEGSEDIAFADGGTLSLTVVERACVRGSFALTFGGETFAGEFNATWRDAPSDDSAGPSSVEGPVVALTAGLSHTCALLQSGMVKCWGGNGLGQLGQGDTFDRGDDPGEMASLAPVDLGIGRKATALAAGTFHTCALLEGGWVKCWGYNGFSGALGLGDTTSRGNAPGQMGEALPPVNLGSGRTAIAIAAGEDHSCALLDTGAVKCWGDGALGTGAQIPIGTSPAQMGDNLPAIDFGLERTALALMPGGTCALLDDGELACWDDVGSLPVQLGDSVSALTAASSGHTCALSNTFAVKCWGRNEHGSLGLGDTTDRGLETVAELPSVDLGLGHTAHALAVGRRHTCAVLDDGEVKCWGDNEAGELGLGDPAHRGDDPGEMGDALPVARLGVPLPVTALAAGSGHTCALFAGGAVKCWGANDRGQLGLGDRYNRGNAARELDEALPFVRIEDGEVPPCAADTECSSGYCVDGMCCASACDGVCETCRTGSCEPLPRGTADSACGVGISCDGAGECGPPPIICTANAVVDCGSLPASATGGRQFVAGVANAICNAEGTAYDTSACVEVVLVGEGASCTGSGAGNCQAGLQCFNLGTTFGRRCQDPCDPNASGSCPTGRFCFESAVGDFCQDFVATGARCTADEQCRAGDQCTPVGVDAGNQLVSACAGVCSGGQVGTQGSCRVGENCIANNIFVEVQNQPTGVTCSGPSDTTSCDSAGRYTCVRLDIGYKCARPAGFCAPDVLPMYATPSAAIAATTQTTCVPTATGMGESPRGDGSWCGLVGVVGTPAAVSCVDTGEAGVCVGLCGGLAGVDRSCGEGYACARPTDAADVFFFEAQDPPPSVACTTVGAQDTCDAGYACRSLQAGLTCARPAKVCAPL